MSHFARFASLATAVRRTSAKRTPRSAATFFILLSSFSLNLNSMRFCFISRMAYLYGKPTVFVNTYFQDFRQTQLFPAFFDYHRACVARVVALGEVFGGDFLPYWIVVCPNVSMDDGALAGAMRKLE